MQGFASSSRTTFQKYKMQPGVFITKVTMDFNPAYEKDFDVNLAVYAEFPCKVSLASNQEASALAGTQVSWTGQEEAAGEWHTLAGYGNEDEYGDED